MLQLTLNKKVLQLTLNKKNANIQFKAGMKGELNVDVHLVAYLSLFPHSISSYGMYLIVKNFL